MKIRIVRKRKEWCYREPVVAPAMVAPRQPESKIVPMEQVKRWDAQIEVKPDAKRILTVRGGEDGEIIHDYLNVRVKGYLSTFHNVTKADRQGDYVLRGAFTETLRDFLTKNPVMLRDHEGSTGAVVGSFTTAKEDEHGLYIEALLSNAPDVISVRFKVAEGHLRTMSMGGIFHYKEDGRGIFKVELWEGSIVALPANPDALFSVRSLNEIEREMATE